MTWVEEERLASVLYDYCVITLETEFGVAFSSRIYGTWHLIEWERSE